MSEVVDSWKLVADGFGQRLQNVSAEQWDAPSNCDEWTVRQLVEHSIDVQRGLPAALGADTTIELGDNPAEAWTQLVAAAETALRADGALATVVPTPFGERPAAEAMGIPMMDLLVHTFDLARSIGDDESLPEPIVAHAFASIRPMDEMIRGEGMFHAKVEVADDASVQDQFIAFCGRQP